MKYIWFLTYNVLFLPAFWVATRIISLFNRKVKTAYRERKNLLLNLEVKLRSFKPGRKNMLIHCSSLGEFEQAKPIIEELDRTQAYNFVVSFFSPSGYKHAVLDSGLQSEIIKTYLPLDLYSRIIKFIDVVKPDAVVFIKYDLWFNLLYALNKKNIFKLLANATYDERSYKWRFFLSRCYRKTIYGFFDFIATTEKDDLDNFRKLLPADVKIEMFGDTKFERVNKAKELAKSKTPINGDILTDKNVFVVGSSWDEDDEILFPVIEKIYSSRNGISSSLITIIAPHEPTSQNIEHIEEEILEDYPHIKSIRYSNLDKYNKENVIIIDCIGLLSTLYKYADVAYVGGGLQTGLHNVLEPAAYGIPVIFGNEKISEDAELLIKTGGGIPVNNHKILYRNLVGLLQEKSMRTKIGAKSFSVFEKKNDTSLKLASFLNKHFKIK
jgi:3-deoxy-D-manno-octulosonic-acid transferase